MLENEMLPPKYTVNSSFADATDRSLQLGVREI
jgi:hypothetical protein